MWGDGSVTITQIRPKLAVFDWEPPRPRYCAACFTGFCDLEPKEKFCFCCSCDHISEVTECVKYPSWFMRTEFAA